MAIYCFCGISYAEDISVKVSINGDASYTNDRSVSVAYSISGGTGPYTISMSQGENVVQINDSGASGKYLFTLTDSNGYKTIVVDVADSKSTLGSGSDSITLDNEAPVTTASISGYNGKHDDWYGSQVFVSLNAKDSGCGVDSTYYKFDSETNWNYYYGGFTTQLSEGKHKLYYYSKDSLFNEEYEKSTSINIDKTPPQITAITPKGAVLSEPTCTVEVTVGDVASGLYSVNIGEAAGWLSNGRYVRTVQLVPGNNTIKVKAVDNVGNTSTDSTTVVYDPKPEIQINRPVDNATVYTEKVNLGCSLSDLGGNLASYTVINGSYTKTVPITSGYAYTVSEDIPLTRGKNEIKIIATDSNSSTSEKKITVIWKKRWTVIAYMAGDNTLSGNLMSDIEEMRGAGDSANYDVIAAYDGSGKADSACYKVTSQSLSSSKIPLRNVFANPVSDNELNTGDMETLSDFIKYSITNYPSDQYFLLLSSHGYGWQSICQDDTQGTGFHLQKLKVALSGYKFDVTLMDACLMSMIEVSYQLNGITDYLVASENNIAGGGNDFTTLLRNLGNNYSSGSNSDDRNFASNIVDIYRNQYQSETQKQRSLIAMDISKLSNVTTPIDNLASCLLNKDFYSKHYKEINKAKEEALRIPSLWDLSTTPPSLPQASEFGDVFSFAYKLKNSISDPDLVSRAQSVMDSIDARNSTLIINEWHNIPTTVPAPVTENLPHGLSIYLPMYPENYDLRYNDLDMSKQHLLWPAFIKKDITPPEFVSQFNPGTNTNLSNLCKLEYRVRDTYSTANCTIRASIVDSSNKERSVIKNWESVTQNPDISSPLHEITFYATELIGGSRYLLPNGSYKLVVQIKDAGDNEYKESYDFEVKIPKKDLLCTVETPKNSLNQSISVPDADIAFIFVNPSSPLNNLIVAKGKSNSNMQIPKVTTFSLSVSKKGYESISRDITVQDTSTGILSTSFRPILPGEAGFVEDFKNVDSDSDGIPDFWEYKYWKSWKNTPASCDLSKNDSADDLDKLYSNPQRRTKLGDGLTNKEEYDLQTYFADLDPGQIDLLMEVDYIETRPLAVNGTTRNYVPKAEAINTMKDSIEKEGIKVHFSSEGKKIVVSNYTDKPEASVDELKSLLSQNLGTYTYSNSDKDTDIIHAIFAPGWTKITGLSNTDSKSMAGLYLGEEKGLFVFDLQTKCIVNNRVEVITAEADKKMALDKHEGYILAHEIGHALSLNDRDTGVNDEIMYRQLSDKTLSISGIRKFTDKDIEDMKFAPLFGLSGYFADMVKYKPIVFYKELLPYRGVGPYTIDVYIQDLDSHQAGNNGRKLYYTTDDVEGTGSITWHSVNMTYTDDPDVYGDEFDYSASIPDMPEGTVIHYYIEATDEDGNRTTSPESDLTSGPPAELYSFTVDKTGPEFTILSAKPNPFSPGNDGVKDSIVIETAVFDKTDLVDNLLFEIVDSNGVTITKWGPEDDFPAKGTKRIVWNGDGATDGKYTFRVTGSDQAYNNGSKTFEIIVDKTAPTITKTSISANTINIDTESIEIKGEVSESLSSSVLLNIFIEGGNVVKQVSVNNPTPGSAATFTLKLLKEEFKDDGDFTVKIMAEDEAGNKSQIVNAGTLKVDRNSPQMKSLYVDKKRFVPETPLSQSTTVYYELTEPAYVDITIKDVAGNVVLRNNSTGILKDKGSFAWDGKNDKGQYVSDGSYMFHFVVNDAAGNKVEDGIGVIKNQITANIGFPENNAVIGGIVSIKGTALDPIINDKIDFNSYSLWYTTGKVDVPTNPLNLSTNWKPISVPAAYRSPANLNDALCNISVRSILSSQLGLWDTTGLSGDYTILLVASDTTTNWSAAISHVTIDQTISKTDSPVLVNFGTTPSGSFDITKAEDFLMLEYDLTIKNADISIDIFKAKDVSTGTYDKNVFHKDYKNQTVGNGKTILWLDESGWKNIEGGDYFIEITATDIDGMGVSKVNANLKVSKGFVEPIKIKSFVISDPVASPVITPGKKVTMSYTMSRAAKSGSIKIYDNKGIELDSLILSANAGANIVTWTPSTAGLYICKIQVTAEDGSEDTASISIPVSTSFATGTAKITTPDGSVPVSGISSFVSSITATGKQYPPKDFTTNVKVDGTYIVYEPTEFDWTVNASATESWNRPVNLNITYLTKNITDGNAQFTEQIVDGWEVIINQGTATAPHIIDVYKRTKLTCTYTFGEEFTGIPQVISYSSNGHSDSRTGVSNWVMMDSVDKQKVVFHTYYTVRTRYNASGVQRVVLDTEQTPSEQVSFSFNVSGTVPDSHVVTGSMSGKATYIPNEPIKGDISYDIALPTPNGGTISNVSVSITDNNGNISPSVNKTVNGNRVSGDILANAKDFNWLIKATGEEIWDKETVVSQDLCTKQISEIQYFNETVKSGDVFLTTKIIKVTGTYTFPADSFETAPTIVSCSTNGYNSGITTAGWYVIDNISRDSITISTYRKVFTVNAYSTPHETKTPEDDVYFNFVVKGTRTIHENITDTIGAFDSTQGNNPNNINFTLTLTPRHNGVISNQQLVFAEGTADYDDNKYIRTNIVSSSRNGNTFTGVLKAEDYYIPETKPWSDTFALDSSDNSHWKTVNPVCYYNHPIESVDLSNMYTPPFGFTASGYTVESISNSDVIISITGNTLKATADKNVVDTSWNSSKDTTLQFSGKLLSSPLQLNNSQNANIFSLTGPVIDGSPFLQPVTISDSYLGSQKSGSDMNSLDKYNYAFWWENQTARDNPFVSIYPDGDWNIELLYPDGTVNDSLTVNKIKNETSIGANADDSDDRYTVSINTAANAPAPRSFVTLKGSITDTNLAGYTLVYRKKTTTGNEPWRLIPVSKELQTVKTDGVLGYWDVTGLNGEYEVQLVSLGASFSADTKVITIGKKVSASATQNTYVAAPYNKAYLTFEPGSVSEDIVVTIDSIKLADTQVQYNPDMPMPIGPLYSMKKTPENVEFNDNHHPKLTINFTENELIGIDPGMLSVYHVKDNGEIEAVTVTNIDTNATDLMGNKIVKIECDVPGFSSYMIVPKIGIPEFDTPIDSIVSSSVVTLNGKAEAGTTVTIYNGQAKAGETKADQSGRFSIQISLAEGINNITATETRWLNGNAFTGASTQAVYIELDTYAPEVKSLMVSPSVITPDNDGIDDYTNISFALSEEVHVFVSIIDVNGNTVKVLENGIKKPAGAYSVNWDGKDSNTRIVNNGTYDIFIKIVDMLGNVGVEKTQIIVGDLIPPVLTIPQDMTVEANAILSTVDIGTATATDKSSVTITNDAPVGFPLGTTIVTWIATDANGNKATATQKITVVDTTSPVLLIPADIIADANGITSIISLGDANATDIFPVTITNDAPGTFPDGITFVTWTATDANGNVTTAVQKVTVIERLRVEMWNVHRDALSSNVSPRFIITNKGTTPVDLSGLKIRYCYTIDQEKTQNFWCDYATVGEYNINHNFVKIGTPSNSADYYLEVGFKTGSGTLEPGAFTEVVVRFATPDWSIYNQLNDYSFNGVSTSYGEWDKVNVYQNNSLIWGVEP